MFEKLFAYDDCHDLVHVSRLDIILKNQNILGGKIEQVKGAYHLHGKPGNPSWKIEWYASFHLEYF